MTDLIFEKVSPDEVETLKRGSRRSKYDPLVAALLALDDGEAIKVPATADPESKLTAKEQVKRLNNNLSQLLQNRVKNHPSAEGYIYRKRVGADWDCIVISCHAVADDKGGGHS